MATLQGSFCVRKQRFQEELKVNTITNPDVLDEGLVFTQL